MTTKNNTHNISVIIDDDRWLDIFDDDMWHRHIETVASAFKRESLYFTVLLADDEILQRLNKNFRNKDSATNVLSFPEYSPKQIATGYKGFIGDIAMSYDTLVRESQIVDIKVIQHFDKLLVHSILHLLGFDHILDKDANIMELMEDVILRRINSGQ